MEPLLAEIKMFAGTFAPRGWMFCMGQTLSIAQNTALFSLLGTTYGGDGVNTFQLPNLGGRAPLGVGASFGSSTYLQGQIGGVENVTLSAAQMPMHTHTLNAVSAEGTELNPSGGFPATSPSDPVSGAGVNIYSAATATPDARMNPNAIAIAGGSQPVNVVTPYIAMYYIIATEGVYPSRP